MGRGALRAGRWLLARAEPVGDQHGTALRWARGPDTATALGETALAVCGQVDAQGCTMLHYACGMHNAPALRQLLAVGVNPHVTDATGATALDWARRSGFHEGVSLLVQAPHVEKIEPVGTPTPLYDRGACAACPEHGWRTR